MKKIFLIIGLAAVMSNATSYTAEKHLDRIATALERIASALENQNRYEPTYKKEETPKKTYDTRVNGRSLKAVPTTFIEAEFELTCEEKCDSLYFYDSQIQRCLELNCKGK
jgi:hypothetical protein